MVPRTFNRRSEFYEWGGSAEWPYARGRFKAWRENLRVLDVDYVVVLRGAAEDPERRWLGQHWAELRRVYWTDSAEIWKFEPQRRPSSRGGRSSR
jgi:hypothetical protein